MQHTITTTHRPAIRSKAIATFACHHPHLSFCMLFVGMPLLLLTTVLVVSTTVMLPLAWLFGWI